MKRDRGTVCRLTIDEQEKAPAMNETARTITFAAVAAVSVAVAWFATPPIDLTPDQLANARLGQPFFPEFTDANAPTSIRVVSFDEARAEPRVFAVEYKKDSETGKDLWTIPSHHDYPADGTAMLAKTAASTLGIKRDEFRSASKEDHEELGVIDPLSRDDTRLKGRGQRITLGKGETVLVDLIIGKPAKGRETEPGATGKYHFVRVPTEDSTYVARLDINLSTKFSDWVETNLLKVKNDQLSEIVLDNYSIRTDGTRKALVEAADVKLDRAKSGEPWKLAELDEKVEELDNTKINEIVGAITDLKLVGVRPKPKGLRADLTLDPAFVQNQFEVQILVNEMKARGFEILADREDETQPRLYSREGELHVASNEGVVYELKFGEIVTGNDEEIEIGSNSKTPPDDPADDDTAKKDPTEPAAGNQSSRYLFIATHFDPKYLGTEPVSPERPAGLPDDKPAPTKPTGAKTGSAKKKPAAAAPDKQDADEQTDTEKADTEKKEEECRPAAADVESDASAEPAADDEAATGDDADPTDDTQPEPQDPADDAAIEAILADDDPADKPAPTEKPRTTAELKKEYEALRGKFDADLRAYESKVDSGRKKVDELNLRFGQWYYVISAENFNKLHFDRKQLVKEKGKTGDGKDPTKLKSPFDDADAGQAPETDVLPQDPADEGADQPDPETQDESKS
ncbi:MAG: DUF4340 domain-containing protein [Planctomycetaceae bacterium]|nr:DUF4340 domain-containing protein [Planctomycetaceae bacterium]